MCALAEIVVASADDVRLLTMVVIGSDSVHFTWNSCNSCNWLKMKWSFLAQSIFFSVEIVAIGLR